MRWWCLAAIVAGGCSSSQSLNGDAGPQAAIGAQFAQQRGCPMCHQQSGGAGTLAGNDVAVKGTSAFPANLTPDRTTGLGGWADEQIIRAFRFGVDSAGNELCPTMPRFDAIGDVEAAAIVAYLRSLPSVTRAIPLSMCPPIKPVPTADMAMPTDL
ncbi:MAG TPA: cytochrome c [Polyangia bacterium]